MRHGSQLLDLCYFIKLAYMSHFKMDSVTDINPYKWFVHLFAFTVYLKHFFNVKPICNSGHQ